MKQKYKKMDFFCVLLRTLGASVWGNILTEKEVMGDWERRWKSWKSVVWAGRGFNDMDHDSFYFPSIFYP